MERAPITVELGWPAKELWPNGSRAHHFAVSRARKKAREEAFWATRITKPLVWFHAGGRIAVHITAHRKSAHSVDAQNLIAGLKAHFDGIADALGVDDKFFDAPTVDFADPIKNGRVIVALEEVRP
jgi:hypothetical protein